jgi:hypothetical protein
MTYEDAIKYKNEKYPNGTVVDKATIMKVVVVPSNEKHQGKYLEEVYQSLHQNNTVTDELAKTFSPDGDFSLWGFALRRTILRHITII